ncbi:MULTISPECIES: hypothetical protein [Brevibacillus]|uniref:hypothetical protein n=1 Tax=Brevibacillus TaxID=55080 RepID=UPI002863F8B1|nr:MULTISPECIES: hypothetical protein [Brevibacillus]MDR7314963.1 hypothetical protein [Brevibacillus nitrificans]MED1952632.1 hypothetical protein [Brevibacillus centrosporus]
MIKKAVGKQAEALGELRMVEMKEIAKHHVGYETMPESFGVVQSPGIKCGILELLHHITAKGIQPVEGTKGRP